VGEHPKGLDSCAEAPYAEEPQEKRQQNPILTGE
jgi:hypothetical protein